MQVIVKARHTRLPAGVKQLATEKIERVGRFFDRIDKIEIEVSEEHNPHAARKKHTVEVTASTKGHLLRAVASNADRGAAIDAVVDKLEAQVRKLKDKTVRRGRATKAPQTIRIPARAPKAAKSASGRRKAGANGDDGLQSILDSGTGLRIRRMGRFSVNPMTPKQAAGLIDGSGEEFIPFVNAETDLVSVIYRRASGGYGLLEPAG